MKAFPWWLAWLAVVAVAQAERVIDAQDGAVVRVAANEPNLVEAQLGRVTAFVFTDGMFEESIDTEAGVVYFTPLEEGPRSGFVEVIDLEGQRQRYSLTLVPDPGLHAQRIILKGDPGPVVQVIETVHVPQATPHVAAVKELLRRMLLEAVVPSVPAAEAQRLLMGDLVLTHLASYPGDGLVGELHRLGNEGTEVRYFDEARLHAADEIVAVTTPLLALEPGSSTEVYLVRVAPSTRPRL